MVNFDISKYTNEIHKYLDTKSDWIKKHWVFCKS